MTLVVGAAVVHEGRLLAARRTFPPDTAGGWELPGGKVEPGETPEQAVVREVQEELGCTVRVTRWLHGEQPVGAGHTLRAVLASLVAGEPVPRQSDHDAIRWLGPAELDAVRWLEPDVPFVAAVRTILEGTPSTLRAVFYEEDDARAVAARLSDDGHTAAVERERLAGEDDDEDHPWAVLTDAPAAVVTALAEAHDGWVDGMDEAGRVDVPPPAPLELPQQPRRVKGHFRRG